MEKIIYINSDVLGTGDNALGAILIRNFLLTVFENENDISNVLLVNSGVKLACEGSNALDALAGFAQKGGVIYSCGTCLDFYNLKANLKVGAVGNMKLIAGKLSSPDVFIIRP